MAVKKEEKAVDKGLNLPAPKDGESPSQYGARVANGDPDVYAKAKEALRRGWFN